ncbi:restriction endonuclease subunit S [Colwellia piezophila]|uniref:restriction endonuclease subunit S n=1 Tax=Colwellia piezophila TaxID=211668 RepID=UPI00037F2B69|nr:restriction endonuclease subunit S [Colwellia piezophila]
MSQELPIGWSMTQMQSIAVWGSGGTPSRKNSSYFGGKIPWIKTGDLGNRLVTTASEFITDDAVKHSSAKWFSKGSVIMAMYGATIGRTSILGLDATTNQACAVGNPIENITSTEFLYYLLCSERDNFIGKGKGGAQPNISQALIKAHEILLPPLAEQKEIVAQLDKLLAQVESTKARLDAIPTILKNFRQSVLADAVSGKLTEEWRDQNDALAAQPISEIKELWNSRYEALGKRYKTPKVTPVQNANNEIPKSWCWSQIGLVFDVYVGATPSRKQDSYWKGDISWVSSSEVAFCRVTSTKETITKEGLKNASTNVHPVGTVMLAMIGQGKTRGQPAILDIEACHNQNTAAIRILDTHCISEYLYYFLYERYEETRRVGAGNNQQAMNKTVVQSLAFPLPPFEEQKEIVRRVNDLFAYADKVEAQVNAAQERVNNLTQSLLAKAFNGELTAKWRGQNPDLITGENSAAALLEKIKAERAVLAVKNKTTKNKKVVKKVVAKKIVKLAKELSNPVERVLATEGALSPQQIFDKLANDLSLTDVFAEIAKLLADNKIAETTKDGVKAVTLTL